MDLVLRPLARKDLIQQHEYFWDNASSAVADRFLLAANETFAALLAHPFVGAPYMAASNRLSGLRSWPVVGFVNARVFYVVQGDIVRIVRVLHAKQDLLAHLLDDEDQ